MTTWLWNVGWLALLGYLVCLQNEAFILRYIAIVLVEQGLVVKQLKYAVCAWIHNDNLRANSESEAGLAALLEQLEANKQETAASAANPNVWNYLNNFRGES